LCVCVGGVGGEDTFLEHPMPSGSSDLGLPQGLLHLLQEFQLVLRLLQVAL
jgi:hypothetical protein